jgi:hypothetical protein
MNDYQIFDKLINAIYINRNIQIDIDTIISIPDEYQYYEIVEYIYYNLLYILYYSILEELDNHIVYNAHNKCIKEFGYTNIKPFIKYIDMWDLKHKHNIDIVYNPIVVQCILTLKIAKN